MTAENREKATSDVSVSMHVSHGPHVPVVAGGWWLAAAHGVVVLAARQSTVLSNRWELDLALLRSEQPYHAPRTSLGPERHGGRISIRCLGDVSRRQPNRAN